MKACEQCPNRHLADLFEELGSTEKADSIRESGCNNWKALQYEQKDPETGQPGEVKIVEQCMRDHLPQWFNLVSSLSAEVAQTSQSQRNVVAEGMDEIRDQLVRGFSALYHSMEVGKQIEAAREAGKALPEGGRDE